MKYLKSFFSSMLAGIISLVLVNIFGVYIGVSICVSYINLFIASALGVPGVTALLLFENLLI